MSVNNTKITMSSLRKNAFLLLALSADMVATVVLISLAWMIAYNVDITLSDNSTTTNTTRKETLAEVLGNILLTMITYILFIRKAGITDTVSSRKFLEAAMNTKDSQLFYTVFKFFQQRNIRMRGSPVFQPGEHCEMYVKYFEQLFGTDALLPVVNIA